MRAQPFVETTDNLAWTKLEQQADALKSSHLAQLFADDASRFNKLSLQLGPFLMDFSKQLVTEDTLNSLVALAEEKQLPDWIHRLFAGDAVNDTERRAAGHWALRLPVGQADLASEWTQDVWAQREKMRGLVERLRAGQWMGHSGEPITDVVNIGVGGSDLGPMMACEALVDAAGSAPRVHFASSMEGSQVAQLLQGLKPDTTVFVIASKSFTTQDTMANVDTVLSWFRHHNVDEAQARHHHFIGVSTRADLMQAWGIAPEHQLEFWDWVGGRFSMWSTIGVSLAVKIGVEAFEAFLAGAHFMDEHFRTAPLAENMPVLNALVGVWNTNFLDIKSHAVLPYDGRLKHLPAYLQQLEMESNGKSATRNGDWVSHRTCPIIWGEVGPNAQHAFYQLLHQGTERVASDFVLVANRYREPHYSGISEALREQHQLGLANGLAQSQLLAMGEKILPNADELPTHKRYPGNQPSTTFVLDELAPYTLGALVAMYEHKVFVQSVIWDINPFDQWGVELGKKLARAAHDLVEQGAEADLSSVDSSTAGLLRFMAATC